MVFWILIILIIDPIIICDFAYCAVLYYMKHKCGIGDTDMKYEYDEKNY